MTGGGGRGGRDWRRIWDPIDGGESKTLQFIDPFWGAIAGIIAVIIAIANWIHWALTAPAGAPAPEIPGTTTPLPPEPLPPPQPVPAAGG